MGWGRGREGKRAQAATPRDTSLAGSDIHCDIRVGAPRLERMRYRVRYGREVENDVDTPDTVNVALRAVHADNCRPFSLRPIEPDFIDGHEGGDRIGSNRETRPRCRTAENTIHAFQGRYDTIRGANSVIAAEDDSTRKDAIPGEWLDRSG
ncbi:hypothetical protein C8R47DRAFT_1148097 [Mycena vitilis]|nr:hypothetical protein C8R47DRAFT_1148097 [Mycena vitilis]